LIVDFFMLGLRLLHIVGGVAWVGAAWTFFFFVQPTLVALGTDTQNKFMSYVTTARRLTMVITIAAFATVGAGVTMYLIDVSRTGVDVWFRSLFGIGLSIGAIAALITFVLGPTRISPTADRLGSLGAEIGAAGGVATDAQRSELEQLGVRIKRYLTIDSALLAVAVVFMAGARYL
jgi:hypothetical protein